MSTDREAVLTARGLVKHYGRVVALDRADFDLYSGEVLGVIGDNGAGKTTMIKAISGALVPDEGEIRLDGNAIQYRSPMEAPLCLYRSLARRRIPWRRCGMPVTRGSMS